MKKKSLLALLLAFVLAFAPFTVAYGVDHEEVVRGVTASNRKLVYCGASMYDEETLAPFVAPYTDSKYDAINAKAREITAECKTVSEKAKTVYTWVANNIYYDDDYYLRKAKDAPSANPKDVFETGIAVCQGYAQLMTMMCRAVGVPCRTVTGQTYDEDSGFNVNNKPYLYNAEWHAWNEIYLDGEWRMCDPTWDSQNKYFYSEKLTYPATDKYYCMDIDEFSKDHYIIDYRDRIDLASGDLGYTYVKVGYYTVRPQADRMWLMFNYTGNEKDVVIPEELYAENIYTHFEWNDNIESITFPSTTQVIGGSIVYKCNNLKTVNFNEGLRCIGPFSFTNSISLKNINMKEGLLEIDQSAFGYCTSLEEVSLPSTVKTIDETVFEYCTALKTIELGNNIEEIGENAFKGCTALTTVKYNGTKADWDKMTIGDGNEALLTATIITSEGVYVPETKPTEPPTEETTKKDETTTDNTTNNDNMSTTEPDNQNGTTDQTTKCDHICHKGGFVGVIYKIVRVFWKLFGTNKYCACGVAHY